MEQKKLDDKVLVWTKIEEDEDVHHWENVGDELIGVYVERRIVKGNYGDQYVYDFETRLGKRSVFGAAVLDGKMNKCNYGDIVKIKFLGEIKGKRRSYKGFEVEIGKPSVN